MTEEEYARKMEVIRFVKEMMATVITARTGILYTPSCFIEYGRKPDPAIDRPFKVYIAEMRNKIWHKDTVPHIIVLSTSQEQAEIKAHNLGYTVRS